MVKELNAPTVIIVNDRIDLSGEATSTIVMDTNNDKADAYKQWRRSRDEEAKVLDNFRDPNNPLTV